MSFYHITYESHSIQICHESLGIRSFRSFVIKPFIPEILSLQNPTSEQFKQIELKALRKYWLFLLARKDYLSRELKTKAHLMGFCISCTSYLIEEFIEKGWVDDQKLQEKKNIKKLKKGYALKTLPALIQDDQIRNLEKEALAKLLVKKKHLLVSKDVKEKQKGYRFFLSRGYSIDQIKELMETIYL